MLNKHNKPSDAIESTIEGNSFQWKLATTPKERETAYKSVYNWYLEAGLTGPREPQLWLTLFNALEDTATIIIKKDDAIIGSITTVLDSPLGLPLEELYKDEANKFRSNSTKLCEGISFGIEKRHRHPKLFLQMMHAALLYVHDVMSCTDILMTVHPRQTSIYQSLGCELIGEERSFDKVNSLPALPFRLAPDKLKKIITRSRNLEDKTSPFYQAFFTPEQEASMIELFQTTRTPISEEEVHYFFREKTDLLAKATEEQRRFILKNRQHAA